jgi:hypothetical protein
MLAFIWIVAALGLALWSLACWGLYRLMTLDARWVEDVHDLVRQIPCGEAIERWIPGWQGLMQALIELAAVLLRWVGDWAPLVAWAAWGVGALVIAGSAGLVSLIVVALRPKAAAPTTT